MASTTPPTPSSSVSYLEPLLSSQTPSSSVSALPPTTWDVFLSFRGEDTRYTFTDHLYSALCRYGVHTFRDNEQLRTGEVISDTLMQAIRESKTYVIVFSKNYASSRWCLEELEEIYNCHQEMKRLVIGVYYDLDPSVVRYQTGSYKKAFKKHETRAKTGFGFLRKASKEHRIRSAAKMEKVDKWRLALKKIADLSGQHVSTKRSEAEIVAEIVDRIVDEINPKTLFVAKYPVGLGSQVETITALLTCNTESVTKIGIYGMGGVGKTTLAKAVYNQNYHRFAGCCFLFNVREDSLTNDGKVSLQRKLINKVLNCDNIDVDNVDHGIELIKARICSIRVLIVIDDLDDAKQLDFLGGPFHLGSIIIITTRNEDLLDSLKVENRYKYKVNELSDAESRQLFTKHASEDSTISDTFAELSTEILRLAGGLPLALTVFGSKLFNEVSDEGWRWFIDTLKQVCNKDVEDSLLISFDALKLMNPVMQDIFLDIACFFIGWEEEEVVNIMETYYTYINQHFSILKKRSLLKINNRYKLEMHNLIWDMGRRIAQSKSPDEPGEHSRLWILEDICDVLKNNKGTEAIEGIVPHKLYRQNTLEGVSFTTEAFKRMSKLRFLHLNNVNLTGNFEQKFKDLRWLCWEFCPLECLPSDFNPEKLVILSLPCSKMKTMWEVSQNFKKLKSLNMSYSLDLTATPEFTELQHLETLNLEGCKNLAEIHISIGSLKRLVSLNLCGCVELRFLGDALCDLKALEVLNIGNCQNLETLPTKLGNIKSLKELNAEGLTICELPDSIGRLSKLVALRLSNNENLKTLPDTICELRSLRILDISNCKKMVKVTRLWELDPGATTMLRKLPYIQPSQIALSENIHTVLPSGVGQRIEPDFKDCLLQMLSIAELPPNLKQLIADSCTSLERLPDLSALEKLEMLTLRDCSGLTELPGLEELTSITTLHLTGCDLALLESTLTNHFFQIYSQAGHKIDIYTAEFPDWISHIIGSTEYVVANNGTGEESFRTTVSLDLMPNVSHNFLGTILCFKPSQSDSITYSIKTISDGCIWSGTSYNTCDKSLMVILPRSIFSVTEAGKRIELTADSMIYGIHLLHKMTEDRTPPAMQKKLFS